MFSPKMLLVYVSKPLNSTSLIGFILILIPNLEFSADLTSQYPISICEVSLKSIWTIMIRIEFFDYRGIKVTIIFKDSLFVLLDNVNIRLIFPWFLFFMLLLVVLLLPFYYWAFAVYFVIHICYLVSRKNLWASWVFHILNHICLRSIFLTGIFVKRYTWWWIRLNLQFLKVTLRVLIDLILIFQKHAW